MKNRTKYVFLVLGLLLLSMIGGYFAAIHLNSQQLDRAEAAFEEQDYGKARLLARGAVGWALSTRNQNRGNFLLARSILADSSLSPPIVAEAFSLLDKIPASSEVYPDALHTKAKQTFMAQLKVRATEELLHEALAIRPDHADANLLLFSVYAATNRADRADQVFWRAFPHIPNAEKPLMFRLWFLSQFTRNAANRAFDVGTGIVPPDRPPSDDDVIDRFIIFKNLEPQEALHYGTMASWWLWKTETKTALEILEVGQKQAQDINDEVYLSSLVQTLLNQGEFQKADALLKQWPENQRGFNYFRHAGVCQEALGQFAEAVVSYQRCQQIWPGHIDSNVGYRLQQCFKEIGEEELAQKMGERTDTIRLWLEERWSLVRQAVDYLHEAEAVGVLVEFFQAIEKTDAAEYLKQHLVDLKS